MLMVNWFLVAGYVAFAELLILGGFVVFAGESFSINQSTNQSFFYFFIVTNYQWYKLFQN